MNLKVRTVKICLVVLMKCKCKCKYKYKYKIKPIGFFYVTGDKNLKKKCEIVCEIKCEKLDDSV